MTEIETISTWRMILGLVLGSLVGLVTYATLEAGSKVLMVAGGTLFFGFTWQNIHFLEMVGIFTLFGFPVAITLGLLLGLPLWKFADSRGAHSRKHAASYGAGIGLAMGLIMLGWKIANGLRIYLDDSADYNTYGLGYLITKDGMPTAIGWALEFLTLLFFIVAGGLAGIVARRAAIRG